LILLLNIIDILIDVAWWIIILQFLLSILLAFNVINTYNEYVRALWQGLTTITDPVYRPIRRILPDTGTIDFSPMVVVIILMIIDRAVMPAAYRAVMGLPV
jgi:YggT family protein